MRSLWAILAGMTLLVSVEAVSPSVAASAAAPSTPARPSSVDPGDQPEDEPDDAAQRAAREIGAARDRANAAADALFQAESDLDALDLEQQALEADIAVLESQIDALRERVEKVAVNRFTRSGTDAMPLLTGFRSAGEQAQVDVLIDVVNETSAEDFDEFESLTRELDEARARLDQAERDAEAARDALERRRVEALAEVERLQEIEAQRLQDDAVRRALEAQQAERRRQEEAAAEAMRAQAAALDPVGQEPQFGSGTVPMTTVVTPADGAVPTGTAAPAVDEDDIDSPTPVDLSTGGTGGGLTGVVGAGGRPGALVGDLGGPGWVCPVQGTVAFGDTWGAPRSGGRSHQGVDMIGARGLPIVAVVDGVAQSKVNTLGGNTVVLMGADGNRYYYAHLDSWGQLGPVTAGTVIGVLGDTGNAKFSTPHLHFEIRPGGGPAVNPYATVRNRC